MIYAAVFVRLRPDASEATLASIGAIEGVELHHHEAPTGRLIVTLESATLDAQTSRLGALRRVEGVVVAEPVYAYREPVDPDDPSDPASSSATPSTASGAPA